MKAPPAEGIPAAPEPGQYVEVLPDILWVRLPIPGPLQHINVWLVPGDRGWILVDTGMAYPSVIAAWEELDGRLSLARDLERVVVTHHHPDHIGMAARLAERYGVPVHATPQARDATSRMLACDDPQRPIDVETFADLHGFELDADMRRQLEWRSYAEVVSGVPAAGPALADGQRLATRQTEWQVSVHDGHAPGHACLFSAPLMVLISGDQILPTISSNVGLFPPNAGGDPMGDYLRSMAALGALPADALVLPAHGLPFRTLHGRVAAVRDEHRTRGGSIAEFCREPRSTKEAASKLFRFGRLDPLNRMLALCETLAHLRHLECAGRIGREGRGTELRWLAS